MSKIELPYIIRLEGSEKTGNVITGFDQDMKFLTLKEAVKAFRQLGNMSFDTKTVEKYNMPRLIHDAYIKDRRDGQTILAKYEVQPKVMEGVPEGIYVMLNEKKMSAVQLKMETGFDLGKYPVAGQFNNMYRVATSEDLQLRTGKVKNIMNAARRLFQKNSGNGKKL